MITPPPPPKSDKDLEKNLKAWESQGATIPPPPKIPKNILMREDSCIPEVGSVSYNASQAFRDSTKVKNEYDPEELGDCLDKVLERIKLNASQGETTTNILYEHMSEGIQRALCKELRKRGFSTRRSAEAPYIEVSWDRTSRWFTVIATAAILLVMACIIATALYVSAAGQQTKVQPPQQIERSK